MRVAKMTLQIVYDETRYDHPRNWNFSDVFETEVPIKIVQIEDIINRNFVYNLERKVKDAMTKVESLGEKLRIGREVADAEDAYNYLRVNEKNGKPEIEIHWDLVTTPYKLLPEDAKAVYDANKEV